MFGYGLENLLRQKQANTVVIGYETDVNRAVEEVKTLQPDRIILYSHHPKQKGAQLLECLSNEALSTSVISLSVNSNQMYVQKQNRLVPHTVESVDDLVKALAE